jgi:serine/threonine protein kinase
MTATWLSDRVVERLTTLADSGRSLEQRYEFRDELGRGGMGVVYRAYDHELQRDVAVKVLHAPALPDLAARLTKEAHIIGRLEHPGIVPIYDVGQTADGLVAYVMKLVRGERLDVRTARGLSADEAFRIFDRICDAVTFAHSRGVIHRDLKPENIMLGSFGEVLVLDWGIAKTVDPESDLPGIQSDVEETRHGAIMGTPGYMAPEQATGQGATADARADVYGLGGILAAMFAGNGGGRPLAAIVAKAQAVSPQARYPTATELAADVRRHAAGMPVTAYRENVVERARRLAHNNRPALLLVLVYLVLRMFLLIGANF